MSAKESASLQESEATERTQWLLLADELEALQVEGLDQLREDYEALWSPGAIALPYHSLAHSYHTARLALVLGEKLGLNRDQLLLLVAAGLGHDLGYPNHRDDGANVQHSALFFGDHAGIFSELLGADHIHAAQQLILSTATTNQQPRLLFEEILHCADMLQTVAGNYEHCRTWTERLYEEWGRELPADWEQKSVETVWPQLSLATARDLFREGYLGGFLGEDS